MSDPTRHNSKSHAATQEDGWQRVQQALEQAFEQMFPASDAVITPQLVPVRAKPSGPVKPDVP